MLSKDEILDIIDCEIEDRTIQADESGDDYSAELADLKTLRISVEQECRLKYEEYQWLVDLVHAATILECEDKE